MPQPKKSVSSVHIGQFNVSVAARIGQSSSSRFSMIQRATPSTRGSSPRVDDTNRFGKRVEIPEKRFGWPLPRRPDRERQGRPTRRTSPATGEFPSPGRRASVCSRREQATSHLRSPSLVVQTVHVCHKLLLAGPGSGDKGVQFLTGRAEGTNLLLCRPRPRRHEDTNGRPMTGDRNRRARFQIRRQVFAELADSDFSGRCGVAHCVHIDDAI